MRKLLIVLVAIFSVGGTCDPSVNTYFDEDRVFDDDIIRLEGTQVGVTRVVSWGVDVVSGQNVKGVGPFDEMNVTIDDRGVTGFPFFLESGGSDGDFFSFTPTSDEWSFGVLYDLDQVQRTILVRGTAAWPDADGDGADVRTDCDDANPAVHPGADEICNGVDDDCDEQVDEDLLENLYLDADDDTYGADPAVERCPEDGWIGRGGDCDDDNDEVHPDATEVCNGIDDDCDGAVDILDPDAVLVLCYADDDNDDYGGDAPILRCGSCLEGEVSTPGDCADQNPAVHPGAFDLPNGVDDDCDGLDCYVSDGHASCLHTGTWFEARAYCDAHFGGMEGLTTTADYDRLQAAMTTTGVPFTLLGVTDDAVEGVWLNLDGTTTPDLTPWWTAGNPNNQAGDGSPENYVGMSPQGLNDVSGLFPFTGVQNACDASGWSSPALGNLVILTDGTCVQTYGTRAIARTDLGDCPGCTAAWTITHTPVPSGDPTCAPLEVEFTVIRGFAGPTVYTLDGGTWIAAGSGGCADGVREYVITTDTGFPDAAGFRHAVAGQGAATCE